jgi:hypothetical protein
VKLSEHFTLAELTVTDHREFDNTPGEDAVINLARLALLLERVRSAVGYKPGLMVTSGYRSKAVNDSVGSKDTSQHRLGCAADIRVPGLTPKEVIEKCLDYRIDFDQIILEFDSWVHISVPNTPGASPRNSRLIIDKTGTRPFI